MARLKPRVKKSPLLWQTYEFAGDTVFVSGVFPDLAGAMDTELYRLGTILLKSLQTLHTIRPDHVVATNNRNIENMLALFAAEGSSYSRPHGSGWNRVHSTPYSDNIVRALDGRLGAVSDEKRVAFVESMLCLQFITFVACIQEGTPSNLARLLRGMNDTVVNELLLRGMYEDRGYMAKLVGALRYAKTYTIHGAEGVSAFSVPVYVNMAREVCALRGWHALTEGL